MPITDLRNGESGIIKSVDSGWGFKRRIMDMGLTPGTKVTVIRSAPFHGPVEVDVRGSKLALGRGMAEKIFVEKNDG